MAICDLPDMYALSPWDFKHTPSALELQTYISDKSHMPMLQLLHLATLHEGVYNPINTLLRLANSAIYDIKSSYYPEKHCDIKIVVQIYSCTIKSN